MIHEEKKKEDTLKKKRKETVIGVEMKTGEWYRERLNNRAKETDSEREDDIEKVYSHPSNSNFITKNIHLNIYCLSKKEKQEK